MNGTVPAGCDTADLVRRAQAGERDALDRLFALAADRVLLFLRLRLGPGLRRNVESMDVLQEVYAEAQGAFSRFEYRGEKSFAHWLCRIGENRLKNLADHFGAQKRQPPGVLPIEKVRATETGPATSVARRETRDRLAGALERLEPEEREALLLRYFQDLSQEEIAQRIGRSPTATRRLLARALLRVGTEFGHV